MNCSSRTIALWISLAAVLITNCQAKVIRMNSYAEGLEAAKLNNAILVVLVHGSNWNTWGEQLNTEIFKSSAFESSLPDATLVFADVDILQSPGEAEKKANETRNRGWDSKAVYTYPAISVYAPDGTLLSTCQGSALPESLALARSAIHDLIALALQYENLKKQAQKAYADNDAQRELQALAELGAMPLTRLPQLLERIKTLDPKDAAGHAARLSFPRWNNLLADITKRTQGGQAAEAEAELNTMLESKAYSREQRALLLVALGNCHRLQKDHQEQAAAAFKKALQVAPDSFAGQMAERILSAWYQDHAKQSITKGQDKHVGP
ncbi:MAG: hypothetical protein PHO37_02750 [Kiritimatiellae bacterium]|nr:hypothetical protein [Kiritimatiellia bacterium]